MKTNINKENDTRSTKLNVKMVRIKKDIDRTHERYSLYGLSVKQ